MKATNPTTDFQRSDAPICSVIRRKQVISRWYAKLRDDPKRREERLEKQRERRATKEIREKELQDARARWAAMPKDHPRKKRIPKRKEESVKAKRKRDLEKLTDGTVANRYLHMKVDECPKELIEIKRQHIRLSRALGVRIKTV